MAARRSLSLLLAAGAGLALFGCQPGDRIRMEPDLPSAELRSCATTGGFIAQRGKGGRAMCVHPYGDAGKACTGKADCRGKCIATAGDDGLPRAGQPTAGFCQADDKLFGCYAEVENGVARRAMCVD